MASAFTRSQIVAALIAFFISLRPVPARRGRRCAAALAGAGGGGDVASSSHFMNIARGVIDTRDLVYYASIIFVCLLIAQTTLDSRRWR